MQRRSVDGRVIFDYQRSKSQSITMVRLICPKCKQGTRFYAWQSRALMEFDKHQCPKTHVSAL